jgi:hypothetical protein
MIPPNDFSRRGASGGFLPSAKGRQKVGIGKNGRNHARLAPSDR